MGPTQLFMDTDLDIKPHITAKVAPNEEKINSLRNSGGKGLICRNGGTKIETQAILGNQSKATKFPEDLEVDIVGSTIKSDIGLTKSEDPDATDYSSSFADSASDIENCSGLSEGEVESQFFGDNGLGSSFDTFGNTLQLRKKKLTNHWRNFIRPLMWRCKWTELRIKEMELQALKYARELAAYDQRKQPGFDQFTFEGLGSKSLPFSSQCFKKKTIKRRKRKRVEDTTDLTSYMSKHHLFSYLELKKSDPDGISVADDFGNPVITDQNDPCNDKFGISNDWSFFEFRDGDNFLEQVLWKIELVHSRVHKLKSQIDVVMSKNAARFSSSENLSLLAPGDAQTSSAYSPTFSAGNGDAISVGPIYSPTKHISEYDHGDLVMPESAISSYKEAIHVPDIIESTAGLLSAADVTLHQPQTGDSCEDIVDSVLVHNEAAEAERHSLKMIGNQATEMHQEPEIGEQESTNLPLIPKSEPLTVPLIPKSEPLIVPLIPKSEPLTVEKSVGPQEQSTLKTCLASDVNFPKNKRKRGERKAGSVGWSKRSSGEPDSQ
ncbi:hypothetical protein RGQ29_002579 [Quercus rubra]|uniref:Uncharacterized protein n=1 Tax=Quercus rubra TaxID=3512 RepID=A0AAN7E9I6_QUERU|nr:hypothetical protein RGQ29_002579 [Quercus rubra]